MNEIEWLPHPFSKSTIMCSTHSSISMVSNTIYTPVQYFHSSTRALKNSKYVCFSSIALIQKSNTLI